MDRNVRKLVEQDLERAERMEQSIMQEIGDATRHLEATKKELDEVKEKKKEYENFLRK